LPDADAQIGAAFHMMLAPDDRTLFVSSVYGIRVIPVPAL
jgi:hypothetical protein